MCTWLPTDRAKIRVKKSSLCEKGQISSLKKWSGEDQKILGGAKSHSLPGFFSVNSRRKGKSGMYFSLQAEIALWV